jgi:hypothetical protein
MNPATPLHGLKAGDTFQEVGKFVVADAGGAAWKRGTRSFRVRMTNSHVITPAVCKILLQGTTLEKEYDNIPLNNEKFENLPRLVEDKNRYFNILPNSHSRVMLTQIGDDETSTYVNGNWMDTFEAEKSYIACQGPMPNTLHDFWRMVRCAFCRRGFRFPLEECQCFLRLIASSAAMRVLRHRMVCLSGVNSLTGHRCKLYPNTKVWETKSSTIVMNTGLIEVR